MGISSFLYSLFFFRRKPHKVDGGIVCGDEESIESLRAAVKAQCVKRSKLKYGVKVIVSSGFYEGHTGTLHSPGLMSTYYIQTQNIGLIRISIDYIDIIAE